MSRTSRPYFHSGCSGRGLLESLESFVLGIENPEEPRGRQGGECGPWLSVASLCVRKKTTWTAIFRAAASFMRYLGQYHAWFTGKAANRAFKFIKHKHENTGAGHIFKSACWHLNRRISTGPCRMKTIKWSYIMESSRLFIFRSQIIFWRSSSTSTVYFNVNNVMMTSFYQSPS